MSATELEEVQALLHRVLPDPGGFAGRLLRQAVTQFGPGTEAATAAAFYAAEDVTPGEGVIVADRPPADQAATDITIMLAAALGACECWGFEIDCTLCRGSGTAGWTQPDPVLFEEFVRPALDRLSAVPRRDSRRQG